ncbi:hypothetical protein BH23CHL7_BH23CHL7_19070 [soil metagenome]
MDDRDRRIEELERRFEEMESRGSAMERAMDRSRAATRVIVPEDTRRHLRAAGREQLLAVRSLLDYWIDRMVDTDGAADPQREDIRIE